MICKHSKAAATNSQQDLKEAVTEDVAATHVHDALSFVVHAKVGETEVLDILFEGHDLKTRITSAEAQLNHRARQGIGRLELTPQ